MKFDQKYATTIFPFETNETPRGHSAIFKHSTESLGHFVLGKSFLVTLETPCLTDPWDDCMFT